MKTTIIALACALTAPFAFAQTSTTTTERTTTANPVTTTSETTTTSSSGTVTTYEPGKTIVIRGEAHEPVSYVLGKTVHYMNKAGHEIKEHIRPGARVHVYYDGTGETRVVNRVVVDDED
ncbi:MAG: hypothetical protein QOG67_786 [Verrucomicrobiota bacterium]